ncbi:glycosyltransferase family 4 protein [Myxococcota bacterium]|nr:glycosyltransferase family 4 protein [Myxococcota bacterium]
MTRWLLVTGDLPPTFTGGVASWVDDLAGALVAGGDTVTVLGRAGRGGDRVAERTWDLARPYPVRRMWSRSFAQWQAWWVDLHGASLLRDADAVLFSTWPLACRLGPRARARGLPVGVAFHGSDLTRLAAPSPAFRAAVDAATALLPVSRFLAGELARLGAGPATVLPMPLPLVDEPAPSTGRRGLLTVARLTPLKGVDRAIRLAQALGEELVVIGDGPALPALRAAAGPETRFLGRLDRAQTRAWYRACRACLLLSRTDTDGGGAEGLGLTLLEAMAQGAVAVGSGTGGVPEAVGTGLVLPDATLDRLPLPAPAELDALRRLLDDPLAGAQAAAWVWAHHGPARARATLTAALERPR